MGFAMRRSVAFVIAAASALTLSSAVSAQDSALKRVWCVPPAPLTQTVVVQCPTNSSGQVINCVCPVSYVLVVPEDDFVNDGGSPSEIPTIPSRT